MNSGSDNDSDSVNDDVSFNSSDDEAIIYRMELAERRRRQKNRRTTRENEKKMVNNQQLKPPHVHHLLPVPVRDNDGGNIEHNNKISTLVAVEATTVCEAAMLTSQLQPVACQQQQQSLPSSTTSTISSNKSSNANNNSSNSVPSSRKRKRETIRSDWMEMYQRLIEYKKEHDDSTKVPKNYTKDPKLGQWVATQKKFNNNNKLLHDRYSLLDSIDFDWGNGPNTDWMEMYQQLVEYKQQHNNTNVIRSKEDLKLGTWVNNQRSDYKNKTIKEERASLLDSIGFDWRDKKRKRIKTSKTIDEVPLSTCSGSIVHTHHSCASNDTTIAAGSSSSTSRCTSFVSKHGPILDDSSDDDDYEGNIIII